jgi:hypothetical protein
MFDELETQVIFDECGIGEHFFERLR